MDVVEASIAVLRAALEAGKVTSVGLVAAYLTRIAAYDHHGIRLNSVPVLSPTAFDEARASDMRRARGKLLSPLDGIPYTAKDSYKTKNMTVSAGSPAFRDLVAGDDSFAIGRMRGAGAILLGLTTMPPMANGGMQRGLDGRAESPYNGAYLTSAWASGSSNGSGTATAASFGAFGLGEETWSSGRAPASCNALCAYTPSWGVISTRGNWPLVPTMDVVVPHTRSMADMLEVLDVLVADDVKTHGDFWRVQPWVEIPKASALRPASYPALAEDARGDPRQTKPLQGLRIGMPTCYLGVNPRDIRTRWAVTALAKEAAERLRSLGAEVVECAELPVREGYERRKTPEVGKNWFQGGLADRGFVTREFFQAEIEDLCAFSLEDFLATNAAESSLFRGKGLVRGPTSWADVDPDLVFPLPVGQIENDFGDDMEMGNYVGIVKGGRARAPTEIPHIVEGVRGLDRARRELLDEWMDAEGLAALAFPTLADIAPADADTNPASHLIATEDGTWVANGNLFVRHLGIPTVTVPMGLAKDIEMPFGLTLAGRGWDDSRLLRLGALLESVSPPRPTPPRTPAIQHLAQDIDAKRPSTSQHDEGSSIPPQQLVLSVDIESRHESRLHYVVRGTLPSGSVTSATVTINGVPVHADLVSDGFTARGSVAAEELTVSHSQWRQPYGTMIVATATGEGGEYGCMEVVGGC